MRRRRWPAAIPLLLLAGVCAALAWQVRWQLDTPAPKADAAVATPAPERREPRRIPAAPGFDPPPAELFDVVVARNLFSPDRQPPPPEDDGSDLAGVESTLELTLTGVVLSDTRRVAILSDPIRREVVRLSPGESHRGWTLVRLGARSATFEQNGREATLEMSFVTPGVPAGPGGAGVRGRDTPQQAQRDRSGHSVQQRRQRLQNRSRQHRQ